MYKATREDTNKLIYPYLKDKDISSRSWIEEDQHLENGCYMCSCLYCRNVFFGYKRRIVCKLCCNKKKDNK